MSKKTIVGAAIVLTLLILGFFIFNYEQNKKANGSDKTKDNTSQKVYYPYDYTLLHDCLNGLDFKTRDAKTNVKNTLTSDLKNTSYVFIGDGLRADSSDYKALLAYLKNGNDVFISSKYVANQLIKHFKKDNILPNTEDEEFLEEEAEIDLDNMELDAFSDTLVNIALTNPENFAFKTGYYNYFQTYKMPVDWFYFDNKKYNAANFNQQFRPVGQINQELNCICLSYGEGNLFLHSSPLLFANIELKENDAKDYTMKLFSLLKKGNIIWDDRNRTSYAKARNMDNDNSTASSSGENESKGGTGGGENGDDRTSKRDKTLLQYVLSSSSLAWAWYSLLAMGLIFLIFSSKRRQRTMPVLAQNKNTSLSFIQTIGRMYFNKQDHASLARLQFKQWQWFVRERYGLKTNQLDVDFEKQVVLKSGVQLDFVHRLLESGKYIDNFNAIEENLIEFHKELNVFYKSCK